MDRLYNEYVENYVDGIVDGYPNVSRKILTEAVFWYVPPNTEIGERTLSHVLFVHKKYLAHDPEFDDAWKMVCDTFDRLFPSPVHLALVGDEVGEISVFSRDNGEVVKMKGRGKNVTFPHSVLGTLLDALSRWYLDGSIHFDGIGDGYSDVPVSTPASIQVK